MLPGCAQSSREAGHCAPTVSVVEGGLSEASPQRKLGGEGVAKLDEKGDPSRHSSPTQDNTQETSSSRSVQDTEHQESTSKSATGPSHCDARTAQTQRPEVGRACTFAGVPRAVSSEGPTGQTSKTAHARGRSFMLADGWRLGWSQTSHRERNQKSGDLLTCLGSHPITSIMLFGQRNCVFSSSRGGDRDHCLSVGRPSNNLCSFFINYLTTQWIKRIIKLCSAEMMQEIHFMTFNIYL